MHYSPLRYPGGKAKLASFMGFIVEKMDISGGTYIEPFAGGAGIAIELLLTDKVNHIVINDYDKAIASFWHAVTKENARFIDAIYNVPITIDEWYRQKKFCKTQNICVLSWDLRHSFLTELIGLGFSMEDQLEAISRKEIGH